MPPAQGQGQGGALVLAVAGDQQEFAAPDLQGGGRQQLVPPAVHGELLHAEQGGPFAEECLRQG